MLVLVDFLTPFSPYWSSEWAVRVIVRFSGRPRGSLTAVWFLRRRMPSHVTFAVRVGAGAVLGGVGTLASL